MDILENIFIFVSSLLMIYAALYATGLFIAKLPDLIDNVLYLIHYLKNLSKADIKWCIL